MHQFIVEVLNYRPSRSEKVFKGFFTLVNHSHGGEKTLDCRHFVKDGKEWIMYPYKEVQSKDDPEKKDTIPLISYPNKDYANALQAAIIEKIHKTQNNTQSDSYKGKPSNSESSLDWFQ